MGLLVQSVQKEVNLLNSVRSYFKSKHLMIKFQSGYYIFKNWGILMVSPPPPPPPLFYNTQRMKLPVLLPCLSVRKIHRHTEKLSSPWPHLCFVQGYLVWYSVILFFSFVFLQAKSHRCLICISSHHISAEAAKKKGGGIIKALCLSWLLSSISHSVSVYGHLLFKKSSILKTIMFTYSKNWGHVF